MSQQIDARATVLVVEDDPVVARVHCRLITTRSTWRVVGVARTAAEARHIIALQRPQLLLLDIGLPGGDGLELLRDLRSRGSDIEVVVVTARAAPQLVRSMLHLGVIDYLVKPFSPERLLQALRQSQARIARLGRDPLPQGAIDALRRTAAPAKPWVPRDLSVDRLEEVRAVLAAAPRPLPSEDVAAAVGIARVTARRYLEYLVTIQEAVESEESGRRGRPRKYYARSAQATVGA